ncbi:MAG: L-ribulose-5-phosphate 4-epimerase [Cytophagales bacterium]|nr:L-ribulose-5-phosphate 4-epimerase [Cytophagales bacterium]
MNYKELKQICYEANMMLPKLGLVIFTFGNASAADRNMGVFAIKPSGVPYTDLIWQDIVVLDYDNNIIEGNKRPSSDTKTHALLYKSWNDAGGIVHTHSTYATAWAQAGRDIPNYGTTHADHLVQNIPCAPPLSDTAIHGDYETETGHQIINHFENNKLNYKEVNMVLLAHHAPFAWGTDVHKAVYNSAILEEIAKMAWLTEQINPNANVLPEALMQKHYERKHGSNAYYGQ